MPAFIANIYQRVDAFVERANRRPCLWLTVFALLLAIQISPWWYTTRDGCTYLSIARSFALDETVTNLGQPRIGVPPAYPLMISPAFRFSTRPFLVLSIIQWLIMVVFLLGVYQWAKRQFPSVAIVMTGLAVLNASVWFQYRRTLKEIAFMAVMIWTVNVLHGLLRPSSGRATVLRTLTAAALMVLMVMVRYAGIVVAAGFGVAMLWDAYGSRIKWSRAVTLTLAVGLPPTFALLGHLQYELNQAAIYGGSTYLNGFSITANEPSETNEDASPLPVASPAETSTVAAASKSPAAAPLATVRPSAGKSLPVGRIANPSGLRQDGLAIRPTFPSLSTFIRDDRVTANQAEVAASSAASVDVSLPAGLIGRLNDGLRSRIGDVGRVSVPGMFKAYSHSGWRNINMAAYLVVLIVAATGWWRLVRRRHDVLALTLPFYMALYIAWPFGQGARFMVPMAPVLMISVWYGLARYQRHPLSFAAFLLGCHLTVAIAYWAVIDAPRAMAEDRRWEEVDQFAAEINREEGSVLVSNVPRNMHTMFQLKLDKPIPYQEGLLESAAGSSWVVMPKSQPTCEGYVVKAEAGEYKLLTLEAISDQPAAVSLQRSDVEFRRQ